MNLTATVFILRAMRSDGGYKGLSYQMRRSRELRYSGRRRRYMRSKSGGRKSNTYSPWIQANPKYRRFRYRA